MTNQYKKPIIIDPSGSRRPSNSCFVLIIPLIISFFFIGRAIFGAIQSRNQSAKPEPAGYSFFSMGNHYYEQGDYTKAIEQFSLAIRMSPDFGEAYNNRGLVYFDQGEYDQAWADFDQAVQLMTLSATPYNNRGATYLIKGSTNAGLTDLNKAIEMNDKFAKAYYNRGLAYLTLDNLDQAIMDFSKAIEYTPEWVTEMLNRNRRSGGTSVPARQIGLPGFIDITQSYADLPSVYSQRGYAYLSKNEIELAVADFNKALELGPDAETKQRVETLLALAQLTQYSAGSTETASSYGYLSPTETNAWEFIQETVVPPLSTDSTDLNVSPTHIRSLAINPLTPTILYAGTDSKSNGSAGSVFISQDGGNNWKISDTGLIHEDVWALAIDPVAPATIYAGTSGDGLFKSSDGGENWENINSSLTANHTIYSLAIDPVNPATIYAGNDTVFKSIDGGENWEVASTGLRMVRVQVLAIDPQTPSTLYAGGNGLFKSTNGGADWVEINSDLSSSGGYDVYSIAIDPITPTTLYIGTWDGYNPSGGSIFKSTNGGQSWQEINSGLPSAIGYSVVVDPMNPANVYLGTSTGIFQSTTGGKLWSELDTGLTDDIITALVLNPLANVLYAGAYDHGLSVYFLDNYK